MVTVLRLAKSGSVSKEATAGSPIAGALTTTLRSMKHPKLFALACCMFQLVAHVAARSPTDLDEGQAAECSAARVNRSEGAAALRALIDRCRETPSIAMSALTKLNMSPLPSPPRLASTALPEGARSEIVSIESTIYFGSGETYPSDEGLQQLGALITHVNESGAVVQSAAVVAGVDAIEAASPIARDIGRGRAETIRRYLVAAGVDAAAMKIALLGAGSVAVGGPAAHQSPQRTAVVVLVVKRPLHAATR